MGFPQPSRQSRRDRPGVASRRAPIGSALCRRCEIGQFIGRLLVPSDVPAEQTATLAGVYLRVDKELGHLTTRFNEEFNQEDRLIDAATVVEQLLERFLYAPAGESLPPMDA
jgi:hypothetical protein